MAKDGYFSGKTEYNKKQGNRGGYQGKPTYGERNDNRGDKPAYGGNRGGYQGKPGYGERSDNRGDKPAYGGNRGGYQGKPGYGERNDNRGDKPAYGGNRGGYQGKPAYGERSDNRGDKPAYGGNRGGYQGKPAYGERSDNRSDKPAYGGNRGGYQGKPGYGERNDNRGERPAYDKRKPYERAERTFDRAPEQLPENTQQGGEDELPFLIIGRNAVREAIRSGRSIDRILVSPEPDGSLREIIGTARDAKIQVRETARKALDELCMPFGHGGKTANHQGIVAYAAGVSYVSVADILAVAQSRGEQPFVVVLDGIMDPHNLGSIIRSAECAGAHGVVIGKRRSASVTAATVKASAGAVEHVAIARVTNIVTAIKELKQAGLWIAGADMAGEPMDKHPLDGPLALVIGNEGEGIGKLVSDSCDFLVSIPMFGKLDSLNASVAAGILLYEKKRQDAMKQ